MSDVFSVMEATAPVTEHMRGGDVYTRFQNEPDALAFAVVDADNRPLGIVERNAFFVRMAAEYGRALYAVRPIVHLMNDQPVIVEGGGDLAAFCGEVLDERPSELLHGFIVVREGRYAGVGSALSLLQAVSRANRAHADEMTRLARTLEQARSEAQAALKAKTEFLAVMSHEIRTPLNGVLGVAEIVARQLRQEELRPYVTTIIDSGQTLLRLLSDALDLSRADAHALTLCEEPFHAAALVDDLAALWTPRATDKGLALCLSYRGDPDLWALGDTVRLKQVFNNLIGNAIKFTPSGGVEVVLEAERIDQDHVRIRASVRDSGPGVPADRLAHIFMPFVQDVAGREHGGAGLGLAICQQLVGLMDGEIEARANTGPGLTMAFEVTLFHVPPEPGAKVEPQDEAVFDRRYRVLIADDNATNRLVAETLVQMMGLTPSVVCDGREAVAAMEAGDFDLVLMDIKMPVMDGIAAAAAIRRMGGAKGSVPILAVTANADPWDAADYISRGMCGVVEKPIRPQALLDAMRIALNDRTAPLVASRAA